MKVLICGSRNWKDQDLVVTVLEGSYHEARSVGESLTVVEGCARGADTFAHYWRPSDLWVTHQHYHALWEQFGRRAGPMRNIEMAKTKPDIVYAFHDNLEKSLGTRHMVKISKEAGFPVVVISHA